MGFILKILAFRYFYSKIILIEEIRKRKDKLFEMIKKINVGVDKSNVKEKLKEILLLINLQMIMRVGLIIY